MDLQHLFTAQDRIAWTIAHCKTKGMPPATLAEKVGISRPGLLHWTKETTEINSIGVGVLMKFAQVSQVNLEWLLTGRGHPTKSYTPSEAAMELAEKLEQMASEQPAEFRVITTMIKAVSPDRDKDDPLQPA